MTRILIILIVLGLGAGDALGQAVLTATPVDVPAGGGAGYSTIEWRTLDGSNAELYKVGADGSLQLLSRSPGSEIDVDRVLPGTQTEYRLVRVDDGSTLATATIVGTYEVDPSLNLKRNFRPLAPWMTCQLLAAIALVIFALYLQRRSRFERYRRRLALAATAIILGWAIVLVLNVPPSVLDEQPPPDVQETVDAAEQLASGNGYVTYYHDGRAQPPRYPPGFSIVLAPLALLGHYPENILRGTTIFALLYLGIAMFAAYRLGGEVAAIIAALFVCFSTFIYAYAALELTEAFTAVLVVVILLLLDRTSTVRSFTCGAIAGALLTIRFQTIVCVPALLLALPTWRDRMYAAAGIAPFVAALAGYNWLTFGSPLSSGYDYWLPDIKPFAAAYSTRFYPQGDSPLIVDDRLQGWGLRWMCPCEAGGPMAALPNVLFYPLTLLGVFWIFAPPFITGYGLWRVWVSRREMAARFTLWLSAFTLLLFTFYFYKGARFLASVATILLIFAAAGIALNLQKLAVARSVNLANT